MNEQYFKEFFGKSPTAYSYHRVIFDDQGIPCDFEFLELNGAYEKLMGISYVDVINKRFYEVFPKGWEGESLWTGLVQAAVINQQSIDFDMYHYATQKWIRVTLFFLSEDIFACIYTDVMKEYMLGEKIEGLLKVNPDMLCVANTDGEFIKVNQKFESTLGYKVEELEGKSFLSLIHVDDIPATMEVMKDLEKQQEIMSFINRVQCKDGSYKYLEWRSQPNGNYVYASARDITEKKKMEMQLYRNNENLMKLTEKLQEKNKVLKTLAVTDELTGLYNRHFLDQRIENEMNHSDRDQQPLSMIILDLDHFKNINDTWGHPAGDEVLRRTADLTNNIIRQSDFLVRLGGEEFAILMPRSTVKGALVVAEKIRAALEQHTFPFVRIVTASFGVAERQPGESFYDWYKRADIALYRAKEAGRNCVISADDQASVPVASVHLEWKREWDSGNKEIDQQHRELIEEANHLIYMSLAGVDVEKTIYQLDIVLAHIVEHFRREEQILQKMGYPDCLKHANMHKGLVEKALQLKELYKKGELKSSGFFSFIVDDIIVGHMLSADTDFFAYTNKG